MISSSRAGRRAGRGRGLGGRRAGGRVRARRRHCADCLAGASSCALVRQVAHTLTSSPAICSIIVSAASSRPYWMSASPTATPRMIFSCCT